MASKISTLALKNKVRQFILESPKDTSLNKLIEEGESEYRVDKESVSEVQQEMVLMDRKFVP